MPVLLAPVVLNLKAPKPTPVLELAVVFDSNAPTPTAVLQVPLVFACKDETPKAELRDPSMLAASADTPDAVLLKPIVFAHRALRPTPTLLVPVFTKRALQPRAALVALVTPSTVPALVGVAVAVPVLVEDTHALPFHTLRVGGVVEVSYQVVPL